MSSSSFTRFSRILFNKLKGQPLKKTSYAKTTKSRCIPPTVIHCKKHYHSFNTSTRLTPIGLVLGFSFFKKKDDEGSPEDKLIMTIKRSILCIQKEEYDKAERMLHLALRMAQDMRHTDGITYVYDVLANLAMERSEFEKAERLFTDVMRRLFAKGETEDSVKILHMSSKIAHMAHLQNKVDKALDGFKWTLNKIEENIKKFPDSDDLKEVKAITCDWFGQLLIDLENYTEARKCFEEAYDIFLKRYGETYSELVPILNNLSVAALGSDDFKSAREYLLQALEILKSVPDATNEGILQANLGLIYLKEGLLQQAKTTCTYAYKLGKKMKDEESIEQADYCLEEIKKAMKGTKY